MHQSKSGAAVSAVTRWPVAFGMALVPLIAVAQERSNLDNLEEVKVIAVTPIGNSRISSNKIAGNVQSANGAKLREQAALDVSEFLNRNFGSVFVNQAQNNPLQPDVQFRGFVASPLLGLSQGLAMYLDGVRINEPFGDTVNWALVPHSALSQIDLLPGANPIFGLNSLGGALSAHSKSGFSDPGFGGEVSAGSFGRTTVELYAGGVVQERFAYFVSATHFDEDGWRDFSPSEATNLFGKFSARSDAGAINLSLNHVTTDLIGNGPLPADLAAVDRRSIFTRPDITENELTLLNISGSRSLTPSVTLTANVYVRNSDIDTLNGDDSDFDECEEPENEGLICEEEDDEEEVVEDALGNPVLAAESLEGATINRTRTRQRSTGGSVQLRSNARLAGFENVLLVGASLDDSRIQFDSSTELGALNETRQAVPGGIFVGESFVDLDVDVEHLGIYVSNTTDLSDRLALTLSGRYNRSDIELKDQIGTSLNGDHNFNRFNPGLDVTFEATPSFNLYVGYRESNRVPTPVELTCADEEDPCRLPNAFLADPPLDQVVGRSWELGGRGQFQGIDWHAGVFRTSNDNDIIFISAGALTNQGFFDNIGETKRQGVELNLSGLAWAEKLDWYLHYTYLQATFEETLALPSEHNPLAVDGEVVVRPGDRLPLVPSQTLKAGVQMQLGPYWSFGLGVNYSDGIWFRGDEGNDAEPLSSFAVVHARTEYTVSDRLAFFLKVDNLFDREHETFGLFGDAEEVLGEQFDDPRFVGVAPPRAAWLGLRFAL